MTKINFWLNSASIHQAPLIANLSRAEGIEVAVVCDAGVSPSRKKLGWGLPDFGNARCLISPTPEQRKTVERELFPDSVNVMSGLDVYPGVTSSAKEGRRRGELLIYQTETIDDRGLKGGLRKLHLRRKLSAFKQREDVVLGMGERAVRQLESAGYPTHLIREFAYFPSSGVEADDRASIDSVDTNREFHVGFVGALDKRKNVSVLVDAVRELGRPVVLTLAGDGPLRAKIDELGDNIMAIGPVEHQRVPDLLRRFDLLVLPSLYDGWGAVVNESLLCGTPVVVSSTSGASCLVRDGVNGYVFDPADDGALVRCINKVRDEVERGGFVPHNISEAAEQCFSAVKGAEYLIGIIDDLRDGKGPTRPPWGEERSV